MSEDKPLDKSLSIDEAMKELQMDQEQIKELIQKNTLRYKLKDGSIRIPKMAIMALKLERMTSTTTQFEKVKRPSRKRRRITTSLSVPIVQELVSPEKAMEMLQIDRETLDRFIESKKLRVVERNDKPQIPLVAIEALKLQILKPMAGPTARKTKKRINLRKKY